MENIYCHQFGLSKGMCQLCPASVRHSTSHEQTTRVPVPGIQALSCVGYTRLQGILSSLQDILLVDMVKREPSRGVEHPPSGYHSNALPHMSLSSPHPDQCDPTCAEFLKFQQGGPS